jgi:putative transposase
MPQAATWGVDPYHKPTLMRNDSMTTDPKKILTPASVSDVAKNDIDQLLQAGLADFTLRELLGLLISSTGSAERNVYLEKTPTDKPNGFYDRSLQLGTIPVDVRVPRTRTGEFRPASLPPLYHRGYSEEVQSLLLGLLGSSRSVNAAKDALQKMGLSQSEHDLERVATSLIEELELRNSRPLDADMLAVFVDGKYVELREGDKLRSACIYLVVGLGRDGKKRVLSCMAKAGRENLEDWKGILRGLIERGLRRVMIFIQDDFSGLMPISQGFFPNADVQLCAVHMQRNAKTHLSKTDAVEFQQRWRAIKSSWDVEVGNRQFEELCDRFTKAYPSWIGELRKKRQHYLAFLKYPEYMRKSFSTTNLVEAVNGQLEIMRRNSGGYFHSEDTLKFKLGLAISSLEDGRWRTVARTIASALPQLNAMFQSRFEESR